MTRWKARDKGDLLISKKFKDVLIFISCIWVFTYMFVCKPSNRCLQRPEEGFRSVKMELLLIMRCQWVLGIDAGYLIGVVSAVMH